MCKCEGVSGYFFFDFAFKCFVFVAECCKFFCIKRIKQFIVSAQKRVGFEEEVECFFVCVGVQEVFGEVFVFVGDFFKVPSNHVKKICFEWIFVSFFVEDSLAEVGELVVLFFERE